MRISRGTVAEVQSTDLIKGSPDQLYSEAAIHPIYGLIDFVPVEADRRIVGVAQKPKKLETRLTDCMAPISEDMLISSGTCLLNLVHADWKSSKFFLVIQDTRMCGIVTKADINKLPVRVSIFELLAAYEQILTDRLESCLRGDETWLNDLTDNEAKRLQDQFRREKNAGLELSLISCAALGLKVQVAWPRLKELHAFGRANVDRITKLRNTVSHGKPMITRTFTVSHLSADLKLIEEICLALTHHQKSVPLQQMERDAVPANPDS